LNDLFASQQMLGIAKSLLGLIVGHIQPEHTLNSDALQYAQR
jgi:hypothetical protein